MIWLFPREQSKCNCNATGYWSNTDLPVKCISSEVLNSKNMLHKRCRHQKCTVQCHCLRLKCRHQKRLSLCKWHLYTNIVTVFQLWNSLYHCCLESKVMDSGLKVCNPLPSLLKLFFLSIVLIMLCTTICVGFGSPGKGRAGFCGWSSPWSWHGLYMKQTKAVKEKRVNVNFTYK